MEGSLHYSSKVNPGAIVYNYLFTSESVAIGHPDKVADQISDAILDNALKQDPYSRVACEVMICPGLVIVSGEISTKATIDYNTIVRQTIKEIGYDDPSLGFDWRSCGILTSINKQSSDIALGVNEDPKNKKEIGAGDQGLMFGYACDETKELMPLPIMIAHRIVRELYRKRKSNEIPYLRPDAKAQVTIEYSSDHQPVRVHTIVISTQHTEDVLCEQIYADMENLARNCALEVPIDENTLFYINPTGRFVIGGPAADCGLTGRKIIVDTYGGMGRHGGGAFSGKDPTKVDRSASYAARYIAKNVIAAGLAKRCEIQVSYAIGVSHPISLKVDTFNTGSFDDHSLAAAILSVFDLSPQGIIEMMDLQRPIYRATAFGGHFGRSEPEFSWEKTDRVEQLLAAVKSYSYNYTKGS